MIFFFYINITKYVNVWSLIVSLLDHALYITTLHNNVTAVYESYLFWFCLLWPLLVWFEFGQWALEKCIFINMSQSGSHQMLNFPRLEATSKIFSTDTISTVDIILNVGLTLNLDTFQLS